MTLALTACKLDNRPLLSLGGPATPAEVYAAPPPGPLYPTYAALPPAQAYAYPEHAYVMSRVVHQRPPSYAFAYGDEQPWAWEVADEGLIFAEPYDDDWRYYYYGPDEPYPYFVQDPDYGYAYGDDGLLLALFDAAGGLISADRYRDYGSRAGYYRTRAYDLRQTYRRSPRRHVEEALWLERAPRIYATHDRGFRGFEDRREWRGARNDGVRHDNGRHLGWYKDRREAGDDRRWREERRVEMRREARDERPRREPEARGRRDAGDRGDGWREARAAEAHGRDAGWRGEDRGQHRRDDRGHRAERRGGGDREHGKHDGKGRGGEGDHGRGHGKDR